MNRNNLNRQRFFGLAALLVAVGLLWAAMAPPGQAQDGTPSTPPPDRTISGSLPDLPPGVMLVEGDILIKAEDFPLRYADPAAGSITTQTAYQTRFWIDNGVPVEFDGNVTEVNRRYARNAMAWWENVSGVNFVECDNQNCAGIVNDWVHIQASTSRNDSFVGMQGGRQVLNIKDWQPGIIAHELGHAIGLEHEQNRADRDNFVEINFINICSKTQTGCGVCYDENGQRVDCDYNFYIQADAVLYGPYDFDSIMHYGRKEFSSNKKDTITVLPPYDTVWQNAIGQRNHLSSGDINVSGCMYRRSDWRWVDNTPPGASGGGACRSPFTDLAPGLADTPQSGMLWIEPGLYAGVSVLDKPLTLKSPNGSVLLKGG